MFCKKVLVNYRASLHGLRYICTSNNPKHENNNNADILQSKRMRKMLARQKSIRIGAHVIKAPMMKESSGPKPTTVYRKPTAANQKRLDQISTIFHEHISQIIREGELGVYVDIYQVKVLYDMSSMSVYWDGTDNDEKDKAIQKCLDEKANYLRQTLQSYNIFGYVPMIVFVKNLATIKEKKLDEIFKRLNLNPARLPEEYETDLNAQEDEDNSDGKFRQDTYGLQHDVIMQKVISAKGGKSVGPRAVTCDIENDIMTKFARQDYLEKVSKHLKDKKRDKIRVRKIKQFISERLLEDEVQVSYKDDLEENEICDESDSLYPDDYSERELYEK